MIKQISRFDPVQNRTFEEAERHYLDVHTYWARRTFRHEVPSVSRYSIGRAYREYAVTRQFTAKPRVWRYTFVEFDGDDWLSPSFSEPMGRDHTNTLRDIKMCEVDPKVIVDQTSKQLSSQKYLIEGEVGPEMSVEESRRYYEDTYLPTITDALADSFGLRMWITNPVTMESTTVDLEEPGQLQTDMVEPTKGVWYDEIWFDNADWGAEAFTKDGFFEMLFLSPVAIRAYLIDEETGLDRR
jgi:hypothetical protein